MILFENFYYDVVMHSFDIVNEARFNFKKGNYTTTPNGINFKYTVGDTEIMLTLMLKMGDLTKTSLAQIQMSTWRKTVTIKSGEKRRRQMPLGNTAVITIFVANIIGKFKPLQKSIMDATGQTFDHYIMSIFNDAYTFRPDVPDKTMKLLVDIFMNSEYFYREIAHEMQHYMSPRRHNWMPKVRKREITPHTKKANEDSANKLNKKKLQKYVNYLLSNDEIDSAIAETAMHIIRLSTTDELINNYSASDFVRRSVEALHEVGKWEHYNDKIKRKIYAKLAATYHALRENSGTI